MGRPRKHRDCMGPLRRCHDCGRPTPDYRCAACRAKHLRRWRRERGIDKETWLEDLEALDFPPLNLDGLLPGRDYDG